MCQTEKQKTCITVIGTIDPATGTFSEYIQIPHKVDKIRTASLGCMLVNAGGDIINTAYYVQSNLISNPHDNILGVTYNVNNFFPATRNKEFMNNSKVVSGTYTFTVYNLLSQELDPNIASGKVTLDLEFIELLEG